MGIGEQLRGPPAVSAQQPAGCCCCYHHAGFWLSPYLSVLEGLLDLQAGKSQRGSQVLITDCMALGKHSHLSELQFPHP